MEWVKYIIDRNFKRCAEVRDMANIILSLSHNNLLLSENEFLAFQQLREYYSDFILLSLRDNYQDTETHEITQEQIDHIINIYRKEIQTPVSSYGDFFNAIFAESNRVFSEMETLLELIKTRQKI
jgi:hypothetical protein